MIELTLNVGASNVSVLQKKKLDLYLVKMNLKLWLPMPHCHLLSTNQGTLMHLAGKGFVLRD